MCSCSNGTAATGTACTSNNANICTACTGDFYLGGSSCVAWAPECSVGQHQMQSPSNTEDHVCSGPGSVFLLVIFTRLKFPSVPWMFCASDMLFICPLGHCFEQITCAAAPMVLLRPVTHAHVTMPTSAQHAPGIFT